MEAAARSRALHRGNDDRHLTDSPRGRRASREAALKAQAWAGEAFLHEGEEPAEALAPGHGAPARARRGARRDGARPREPSLGWKVRYGLMLGLERSSSRSARGSLGHRAAPPPGRRARRDAHRADRREPVRPENGRTATGTARSPADEPRPRRGGGRGRARPARARAVDEAEDEVYRGPDPGAAAALPLPSPDRVGQDDRRGRLRRGGAHARRPDPHAPPPARLAVHRDLTTEGYGDRFYARRSSAARRRRARTRSRSRRTRGSRATWTTSSATRTTS